ncbi:arsenate reductase (glutaredoxin) [Sulfitobacter mediterraneus]|uniref:Arsenate reductase n=1 Tax=Sulfitobacter mediterraneus TaxID=83219 RepID=A0A2T6CFY2_9RHOB|nr:arsenate reductase (glutaredoxin) [Sulfitobacter mediterraneus]KIN75752.1 Arsenate reductase [Sulfitobacter mediterraneus KCTC 32188]PTX74417.1 arsenate reductase [Sulfitobacter mediterraneus]
MITIWHNPRCSKSRQTLALIEEAGVEVTVRKYLDDAPTAAEIEAVHAALGTPPLIEMMRSGDKVFKDLGLGKDSSDSELLSAMATQPALIERPIVIKGDQAVIGRPPANVRALL